MWQRVFCLFIGLLLFGLGIVMTIKSNLGTTPWDVLHLGLANYLPLTVGQLSQLTGVAVIVVSWAIGVRPGWGTLANMYFIGLFIDLFMDSGWLTTPDGMVGKLAMLAGGILIIGWGSFFYLSAAFGAGPRDSFMVGIIAKTRWPLWQVRTAIEASVTMLGALLGGPVGVGTLVIVATLGPAIQLAFQIMKRRPEDIRHQGFSRADDKVKQHSLDG